MFFFFFMNICPHSCQVFHLFKGGRVVPILTYRTWPNLLYLCLTLLQPILPCLSDFGLKILGPCSTCHNEDGIWANSPLPRTMEGRWGRYKHNNLNIYFTLSLISFPQNTIGPISN